MHSRMTDRFDKNRARTEEAWAALCDRMSIQVADASQLAVHLIAALEQSGQRSPPRGYTDLPNDFHVQATAFIQSAASPAAQRVLDLVLIELVRQFESLFVKAGLPDSLLPYYQENIARILQRACQPEAWTRSSRDDIFLKDLGILRMWLIPCASHLVFRNSGVPRSLVLRQRPDRMLRALTFFGLNSRGFSPFLENHVHPQMLEHFTPEGRKRCYALVAELLQRWPESRGLMGLSWYYDPVVGTISPRLAYLHNVPERGGALFLPAGSSPDVVSGATSTSETRKKLFEAGKYLPTRYLMAWSKRDLLRSQID